jgi:hypothetical protein
VFFSYTTLLGIFALILSVVLQRRHVREERLAGSAQPATRNAS